MDRHKLRRGGLYLLGQLTLAMGITLNILCALGTSPVSAIPHFVSLVWGLDLGSCVFFFYLACTAVQLALNPRGQRLPVLAQIPVSLVFTRVLSLLEQSMGFQPEALWEKLLLMAGGVVFTGVGVALTLNARLVPCAGDGIVESLARFFGLETGRAKTLFDLFCVAVTFVLGAVTGHWMLTIGVGTLAGAVGVGWVISLFDRLFRAPLDRWMGLERTAAGH